MLVTDKGELRKYASAHRLWQGIPGIERTAKGRMFVCFYSGEHTETMGNYAALIMSDDGEHFTEPIAVADMGKESRAFDSALWIDPKGRLWFIWAVQPECRVEYSICEDPDADELRWSPVKVLGHDIMINKPIVTAGGDWLFPVAVWKSDRVAGEGCTTDGAHKTGAHVFRSRDEGKTFEKIGTVCAKDRWYDEHMLLEKRNGDIEMYVRTSYGIARAVSHDGGRSFDPDEDSGFGGPNSRFYIGRLRSGRVLLVNHVDFTGRNNLTALLSDDDGATFPHRLLIDGRDNVSYPDVCEDKSGNIYIVYDHERGARYKKSENYDAYAKEILIARITEADIDAGRLISPGSRLRITASRLGPAQ